LPTKTGNKWWANKKTFAHPTWLPGCCPPYLAAVVGGWISTDATIPDPTDAAWPKWLAYGTALSGAALIDWLIIYNENSGEDGGSGSKEQCPQDKKLTKGEIDRLIKGGIHPHDLKDNSKQDLFKDKDGNIWVKPKSGIGPGDPTGVNINDF